MPCTPDAIQFNRNSEWVYFKKANCSLVEHWKDRYDAKTKVEWTQKVGESWLLDPDCESVTPLVPGSDWKKGDTVWAVPISTMGAFRDADLIRQLASALSASVHKRIRLTLSESGYPQDALDAIRLPK